jgi:hypothetical protein
MNIPLSAGVRPPRPPGDPPNRHGLRRCRQSGRLREDGDGRGLGHHPAHPRWPWTYDEFGRSINALERVRDNNGRDEVVGAIGTAYNSFGQVVGGQTVTMKGASALLGDKALIAEVAGRLKAGDLISNGAGVVADSGLEGNLVHAACWRRPTTSQGRQTYTDSRSRTRPGTGLRTWWWTWCLAKGWVGEGNGLVVRPTIRRTPWRSLRPRARRSSIPNSSHGTQRPPGVIANRSSPTAKKQRRSWRATIGRRTWCPSLMPLAARWNKPSGGPQRPQQDHDDEPMAGL